MASGSSNSSSQTVNPWWGQQPYLTDIFQNAQKLYETGGPQYFPDNPLAPVAGQTTQAQQQATQYGTGTGPALASTAAAGNTNLITRAGDVANDPWFWGAANAAIRPAVQQFMEPGGPLEQIRSGANAFQPGGGSRQGIAEGIALSRLQQNILDTTAQMGEAAYGRGLTAQGQGVALMPGTMNAQVQPSTVLAATGQDIEAQQQDIINQAIAKWNYEQNLPYANLAQYRDYVQGSYGGQTIATGATPKPNKAMTALGGAASGAAIGSAIPGVGTAVGAIAGLFLGLMA